MAAGMEQRKWNVKDLLDMESNTLGKKLILWALRREESDISIKIQTWVTISRNKEVRRKNC